MGRAADKRYSLCFIGEANVIRKILTVVILVICGLTQSVSADEGTKEESVPQMVGMVGKALIGVEGLFWLNAYMASLNPKVYGVVYAVGASSVATMVYTNANVNEICTTCWVTMASVGALALYNIRLDENKMSKSEIIRANFIGWNAALVISGLTGVFYRGL